MSSKPKRATRRAIDAGYTAAQPLSNERDPALPHPLVVLNRALVLLGLSARAERPEVSPASGLGVLLARVEAILTRRQLSNHGYDLREPNTHGQSTCSRWSGRSV